jgi:hypothetical protein
MYFICQCLGSLKTHVSPHHLYLASFKFWVLAKVVVVGVVVAANAQRVIYESCPKALHYTAE